jgi:Bromodomain
MSTMAPASDETLAAEAAATAQKISTSTNNSSKSNATHASPLDGSSTTNDKNKQQSSSSSSSAAAASETRTGDGYCNINNNKKDDHDGNASSASAQHVDFENTSTTSHGRGSTDLERTLYRLTQGLPKSELRLMLNEADECEKALRDEIVVMEQALAIQSQAGGGEGGVGIATAAAAASGAAAAGASSASEGREESITIHTILESPYTPMDRFWTYSALVGRLRGDDFAIPSLFAIRDDKHPDHSRTVEALEKQQRAQSTTSDSALSAAPEATSSPTTTTVPVKSVGRPTAAAVAADANYNNKALLSLIDNPAYHRLETSANILACWKKIFTNRAAIVFKKAVKPEEAPGYTDRILFPIDLSLIRKMIVTRHIQSYAALHHYIALISHNCCKYNGRESDYGMVARDFEAMADHIIRTTVSAAHAKAQQEPSTSTATIVASATASAFAATVSKSVDKKMPAPTT